MLRFATSHHHTGAASSTNSEPAPMIKPEPIDVEPLDNDHSMRLIEYVIALVALAAAGILAFVR
jgi:hypothetical protein